MRKKQIIACILSFALICGVFPNTEISASKKVSLSCKRIIITKGMSKTLKVRNTKGKVKWKILSGKRFVSLKKKGKTVVTVKARKKGSAKIQATVGKKKLICKVIVKNIIKSTSKSQNTVIPFETQMPANAVNTSVPINSTMPSVTNAPETTNPSNTPLPANPTNAPEGANEQDVKALDKLIRVHRGRGADISEDMSNTEEYQWYAGRLIGIYWNSKNVNGELDVTECSALKYLRCTYPNITIGGYMPARLSGLNVSKNTDLEILQCYGTNLRDIDVSNNINLLELDCTGNYLSNLDVSQNISLVELTCSYNELSSLDVSKNTLLEVLLCDNNCLTQLDISRNNVLCGVGCQNNQLTTLDCSNIKTKTGGVFHLNCANNKITELILPTPPIPEIALFKTMLILICENNCLTTLDFTGRYFQVESLVCDDVVSLIGYEEQ